MNSPDPALIEAADYLIGLYKRLWRGGVVRDLAEAIDAYEAKKRDARHRIQTEARVGVVAGWVLVPREPTEAMIEAGSECASAAVYRRMLAAAPSAPTPYTEPAFGYKVDAPVDTEVSPREEPIPCGGCGATEDAKRCIGCFHDFGTPDSAWVRKYAAPTREEPAADVDVRKAAARIAHILDTVPFYASAIADDIRTVIAALSQSSALRVALSGRLRRFDEAIASLPWVSDKLDVGQQFNAYDKASNDEDDEDEDREFYIGIGPVSAFRFIGEATGLAQSELIVAAMKLAAETRAALKAGVRSDIPVEGGEA